MQNIQPYSFSPVSFGASFDVQDMAIERRNSKDKPNPTEYGAYIINNNIKFPNKTTLKDRIRSHSLMGYIKEKNNLFFEIISERIADTFATKTMLQSKVKAETWVILNLDLSENEDTSGFEKSMGDSWEKIVTDIQKVIVDCGIVTNHFV